MLETKFPNVVSNKVPCDLGFPKLVKLPPAYKLVAVFAKLQTVLFKPPALNLLVIPPVATFTSAIRLRTLSPITVNSPPMYKLLPSSCNALTLPLQFLTRHADTRPCALICATRWRALSPIAVNCPPINQPPLPSGMLTKTVLFGCDTFAGRLTILPKVVSAIIP